MTLLYTLLALLVLIAVALLSSYATRKLAKREDTLTRRNRQARAQQGEEQAPDLLHRHGYKIVEMQARRMSMILVDGEIETFGLRADLIVENSNGRRFVADVKTGKNAPKPTNAATRRQLLEYFLIYQVDGVLLLDMENRKIIRVDFPKHLTRTK